MSKTTNNYQNFIKTNTSRFKGQWIVLFGKKIVAHGKQADVIYERALKKYPAQKISLAKIPAESTLVLWLSLNTKKN